MQLDPPVRSWIAIDSARFHLGANRTQIRYEDLGDSFLTEKLFSYEWTVRDKNRAEILVVSVRTLTEAHELADLWHAIVKPDSLEQLVVGCEEAWIVGCISVAKALAQQQLARANRILLSGCLSPGDDACLAIGQINQFRHADREFSVLDGFDLRKNELKKKGEDMVLEVEMLVPDKLFAEVAFVDFQNSLWVLGVRAKTRKGMRVSGGSEFVEAIPKGDSWLLRYQWSVHSDERWYWLQTMHSNLKTESEFTGGGGGGKIGDVMPMLDALAKDRANQQD